MLASSLSFVDGSVVNVAPPAIQQSLVADPGAIQPVVAAYLLPLGALLLLGGAAGDRFGRRRLMIGDVVVFAVASLGCALAPDFAVLLLGRVLQGVGSARVMSNCLGSSPPSISAWAGAPSPSWIFDSRPASRAGSPADGRSDPAVSPATPGMS